MSFLKNKFDFENLFTFELANNHQGDIEHGLRIIREVGRVAKEKGVRGVFKFQFRNLDTFIHPHHKEQTDNKHIPRFLSTRLSDEQFKELFNEVKAQGFITMCTPFDEISVDKIMAMGFDLIKVASCSVHDWPLLEKIGQAGLPVIASTGGLNTSGIDRLVSFFQHRGVEFALMHCVGIYPTPHNKLQLNKIEVMRNRYPNITIGFSTHEEPDNYDAIKIAYAKGARIFERHVGVPTEKYKLNSYSSTPEQIQKWIQSYKIAMSSVGLHEDASIEFTENKSLEELMRGVYAKRDIKVGDELKTNDVYFAMPLLAGQLKSGFWRNPVVADRNYRTHEAIMETLTHKKAQPKDIIYPVIHEVKAMLSQAKISTGYDFTVELSHHYGLERFREVGAVIIDCINREYCKKLIVQLPGQEHPYHFHKKKEETFQVLHGEVDIEIEGRTRKLYPGDVLTVQRGVWHSFRTDTGVIFEEISTTHFNDDSFYEDKVINQLPRDARKTRLVNWGRFQFD